MKRYFIGLIILLSLTFFKLSMAQTVKKAQNPIIFADVPDVSVIRVGEVYYMSSTTMHMSPGLPIMKSKDLVNWELVSYAYDTLADMDELNLANGKNTYGRGSWASSMRYHRGTYYVSTFAQTTGKTYIFSTKNIEKGPWKSVSFKPSYHDHSLFFDDDGKVYMVYGAGKIKMIQLKDDLSGVDTSIPERVIIENASLPSGENIGLPAEGSQLFKVNGKYYLFNITWPKGGMRTVVIHRSDKITGPYEGKVGLQDLGVAQGGLIDMPNGDWYAYLFRDFGAVGRIPYWVPVTWEDGWPVLGDNGKVPMTLNLPAGKGLIPEIVASDEFNRKAGERDLPLVWQWNHNPDPENWSLKSRKGYLRLTTGRVDTSFIQARNTLTQRTIGPVSSASTSVDISKLKDGDLAGLSVLQKKYGIIGIKAEGEQKYIVMVDAESGKPVEHQRLPLKQSIVFLKIDCDFQDRRDLASFFYSLDGKEWKSFGSKLKMSYTIPHFMGYRYGLFNYASKQEGGYADFDFFRIENKINDGL
jgi:beta-xylosidase